MVRCRWRHRSTSAKLQSPDDKFDVSVCEHEDHIFTGKLHHRRSIRSGQAGKNLASIPDEPVKITLSTPSAMAARAYQPCRQNAEQLGSSPEDRGRVRRKPGPPASVPGAGLKRTAFPAVRAWMRLHRRKKQRIVPRTDDQHDSEGSALHFERKPRIQNGRPLFRRRVTENTRAARRSSQRQASASGRLPRRAFPRPADRPPGRRKRQDSA